MPMSLTSMSLSKMQIHFAILLFNIAQMCIFDAACIYFKIRNFIQSSEMFSNLMINVLIATL